MIDDKKILRAKRFLTEGKKGMPQYVPPFTITPKIIRYIADISELIGGYTLALDISKNLRLRRINRIRTIQGSLAIEGNTLTEEQITAILEGKRVVAPPREIQEVRNALKAYDCFEKWNPVSRDDLLEAHRILMTGLLDKPGHFRTSGVGVMAGQDIIHLAPPADRVPYLMQDLFRWLQETDHHPLLAGSVFHYEFEFIHPFEDGNGRMGRLWQTLILSKWNPLFANLPVESLLYEHQADYYAALNLSTKNAESSVFIEFILKMIFAAVKDLPTPEVAPEVTPEVRRMLLVLEGEMTRRHIQERLRLKDEKHFRVKYQQPAIAQGLIEMTLPDKPNSRLQKYRLTHRGRAYLEASSL
jgi:Fic family protein